MKFSALSLPLLLILLAHSQASAIEASLSASMKPIASGQAAPDVVFKGPITSLEAADLGLPKSNTGFRLSEIRAKAIILVVFSMYCPHCQKEAPGLKKIHELIASKGMSGDLKLVGVGAGNSPFEVNVFREKFQLAFPLIPDQDFLAYKALGQVGTPYFYVLKRQGPGFVVVDGQLGRLNSPEAFLDEVLLKTGLGQGK